MRAPLLSLVLVLAVVATVSLVPAVCNGQEAATAGEEHGGSIKPLYWSSGPLHLPKPKHLVGMPGMPKMTPSTAAEQPDQYVSTKKPVEQIQATPVTTANAYDNTATASTPENAKKEKPVESPETTTQKPVEQTSDAQATPAMTANTATPSTAGVNKETQEPVYLDGEITPSNNAKKEKPVGSPEKGTKEPVEQTSDAQATPAMTADTATPSTAAVKKETQEPVYLDGQITASNNAKKKKKKPIETPEKATKKPVEQTADAEATPTMTVSTVTPSSTAKVKKEKSAESAYPSKVKKAKKEKSVESGTKKMKEPVYLDGDTKSTKKEIKEEDKSLKKEKKEINEIKEEEKSLKKEENVLKKEEENATPVAASADEAYVPKRL